MNLKETILPGEYSNGDTTFKVVFNLAFGVS